MDSAAEGAISPVGLSREGEGKLRIEWSDGLTQTLNLESLQQACPCATCQEKRKTPLADKAAPPSLPILSRPAEQPLRLESMQPVGNYAYSLQFSQGCSKGIYTFDLLRRQG